MILEPGQKVMWRYVPRGGYGFTWNVKATVVKVTKSRVTLDVLKNDGSTERKSVKPENVIGTSW